MADSAALAGRGGGGADGAVEALGAVGKERGRPFEGTHCWLGNARSVALEEGIDSVVARGDIFSLMGFGENWTFRPLIQ